jgi:hypothetical protein
MTAAFPVRLHSSQEGIVSCLPFTFFPVSDFDSVHPDCQTLLFPAHIVTISPVVQVSLI